jgi:hypothetical protein
MRSGKFTIIPVTAEKGKPFNYYEKVRGKGNQLYIDKKDFPTLAKTGLHSDEELLNIISITGRSVAEVTMRGRPDRMSGAGFIAADEDIISVLLGDNTLVKKMELKHSDLATTIFHLWNIIQHSEVHIGKGNESIKIDTIFYNNKCIKFNVPSCRGWQDSIFEDSIMGECHLEAQVELTDEEKKYISEKYKDLSKEGISDLISKLTTLHTGEMVAYYIQMYGFYEGHTDYRADPISLAFIFGLKSLQELNEAFDGKLYEILTSHHLTIFE